VAQLKKLHQANATVRFGEVNGTEEKQIEILTKQIQELFAGAVKSTNSITFGEVLTGQLDKMKKNLKSQLATELNQLSNEFRADQRSYIQKLREIKEKRNKIGVNYEGDDLTLEERRQLESLQDQVFQRGFTDEQMAQVLSNQREILERDRELQTVLQSIVELQDMFKEFHELIVEQGSLLDRIDNNIEETEYKVQEGVEYVKSAETVQKYNRFTICLIFVLVAVIAVAAVLGIKLSVKVIGIGK
jgi:syntaxin 16